jgi:lysophospholipase L1-like esterase
MKIKSILCYGDSNTWGFNPVTQDSFARDERWTGQLSHALGSDYDVIEEGFNGRTTVWDDPIEGYKNGIHFEQSEHAKLAQAVAIKVKEVVG